MKKLLLALQLITISSFSNAQTPNWLWAVTQGGGDCYTEGRGIRASPSGYVYVSGRFGGTITFGGQTITANGSQVMSGKFDGNGNYVWLKAHPGNGGINYNYNIYRDKDNNTYTTGYINYMYVDKYDSSGNLIWQVDPNLNYTSAYGTVTDNAKNVYITGEYSGTITLGSKTVTSVGGTVDMFLAKLDSNGNWKWIVSGGGAGYDGGRAIAIDGAGHIYVLGSYSIDGKFGSITAPVVTATNPNIFIAKYDTAGNALNVTTATNCGFGTSNQFWSWQGLAVDSCGDAYVAGYFIETATFGKFSVVSAGSNDICVAKCNQNGNLEWVQREGGPSFDAAFGIALDKYTDVYISGEFNSTFQFGNQIVTSTALNGQGSPYIAKYANSTGDLQWVQTGGGTGDWDLTSCTVDNNGYVYACGVGGYSGNGVFGSYTVGNNVSCQENNFVVVKLDTTPPRKIIPLVNHQYCPGATVQLPYSVIGSFNAGNVFTAELSDSTGSFASYTILGSVVDTTNGTITITIPANTPPGNTYLIRVVSSNPATSSYANGCGDYYYKGVYINNFYVTIAGNANVKLSNDTSVCSGEPVTLTASGVTSYKWSTGDTTASIEVFPATDTTFGLMVTNGGCVGDTSITVNVKQPAALIVMPQLPSVCAGQNITLTVPTSGSNYSWSPNSGLNATTGDSVVANPTATTTYSVTGTDSLGCTGSAVDVITVNAAPQLIIQPQSPSICNGQIITLTVPTSGSNYSWSPNSGLNTTTGDSVVANPTATITYSVTGTDSLGCAGSATDIITVNAALSLITEPQSPAVCNGQTITLTASAGANATYQWAGTSDATDTINVTPAVNTTYEVMASNGTCSKDTFIVVTVNPAPPLVITPPSPVQVCSGQSVTLVADTTGRNYAWVPGKALSATTGNTVTANPTADITYSVTGIDSVGCSVTGTEEINVQSGPNKPKITLSVTGDTLISSARNGNQWYRDDTVIKGATDSILVITGMPLDTYKVVVTNIANGCSTASDSVVLSGPSGIKQVAMSSGQVTVYPNPTNGAITVNIDASAGEVTDWSLIVTDLIGRTLYLQQLLDFKNEIDLSNLPCSIYFITVINKTGRAVFPVVKQN